MRRNIFNHGYHVSAAEREEQVKRESAMIAQYDARLTCPELPTEWDTQAEPWHLAAWSAEWASAMGCEGATLRAMIEYVEAYESPLTVGDLPVGWYKIGQAEATRLEEKYGPIVYSIAQTKTLRATSIRRIRDARKALDVA